MKKSKVQTGITRLISVRVPHDLLELKPEGVSQSQFVIDALKLATSRPTPKRRAKRVDA